MEPAQLSEQLSFEEITDLSVARSLFKRNVTTVHMEVSSYCNRKCVYCPVSLVDRSSTINRMPDTVLEAILGDLAGIDFAGGLGLSLYNEPAADRDFLLRVVTQARRVLPHASIFFGTNGDYLDRSYLDALRDAGAGTLYVSVHMPKGREYDELYVLNRMVALLVDFGTAARFDRSGNGGALRTVFRYGSLTIDMFGVDWTNFGSSRGDLVEVARQPARRSPCAAPTTTFTVAWDGRVTPCCQLFAESPEHEPYVCGRIEVPGDMFRLYTGAVQVGFRRTMRGWSPKPSPCAQCGHMVEAAEPVPTDVTINGS